MENTDYPSHLDHMIGDKKAVLVSKEHRKKTRKLWEDTFFQDSQTFLDYYFSADQEERLIFAVLEEEEALSMIHLQQHAIAVRRNDGHAEEEKRPAKMVDFVKMNAGLLTGLATRKKYRHFGLTDEVMNESLKYQYDKQYGFSYILPKTDLEKKMLEEYGFAVVEDLPVYARVIKQFPLDMLRACRHGNKLYLNDNEDVSIAAVKKSQLMSLSEFVNEQLAEKSGMFVIRNVPYFEKLRQEMLSDGGNLFLCKREEQIVGYFAVADIEGEEDYREVIFSDKILEDKLFQKTKEPGRQVYARIINLGSMIGQLRSEGKVTVAVQIEDPMIHDNNGIFLWFLDGNGCRMERVEDLMGMKKSELPKPELSVTIGELSAFLMGHVSLKENKKFDSILNIGPVWLTEIH